MEKKYRLEPFNLEKAKAGEPICTREGNDVRIICWDCKQDCTNTIIGLITLDTGLEMPHVYELNGNSYEEAKYWADLRMKVEIKEPVIYAEIAKKIIPFEEAKVKYPKFIKTLKYLIIKTYDNSFLKIWKKNLPSQTWEKSKETISIIGKEWKNPTRHEWIDIYDARYKGLDKAMKEIEGDVLTEKYWTSDEEPIPTLQEYYSFYFDCGAFTFEDYSKSNYCMVRPVCKIINN